MIESAFLKVTNYPEISAVHDSERISYGRSSTWNSAIVKALLLLLLLKAYAARYSRPVLSWIFPRLRSHLKAPTILGS